MPAVITPTVMLPAKACTRTLPPAVLNWASPAMLTPRPACTSIVCPLPSVCTLGWPLAASPPLTTTASAASRVMLPWLEVRLLLIVNPAAAGQASALPVLSSTLPVAVIIPASLSAPLLVCTARLPPVPARLTLFSVNPVACTMYSPPLLTLVAAMDLTCVYSASALEPMPVAALNVTSAVSPLMLRFMLLLSPVSPSMIPPCVAVRLTALLASIMLSVMLPVCASMLTMPLVPAALTERAFLPSAMVMAVLA